ncbi:hypothetical protein ACR2XN_29145, partial [Klebsiella pneumoniae]
DPEPLVVQPISSIPMDSTQSSGNISHSCTTLVVYNPSVSMIPDSSLSKETPICMTAPTFSQPSLISLLSEKQNLSCENESEQLEKIQSDERQSLVLAKGEVEQSELIKSTGKIEVAIQSDLGNIVSGDEIDQTKT